MILIHQETLSGRVIMEMDGGCSFVETAETGDDVKLLVNLPLSS